MPDFFGTDNSETLNGIDGTDRIYGYGGDDTIDGLPQEDVSVYRGNFEDYKIEFLNDGRVRITDNVENRDGTDILTSIEYAEFEDMQVGLQPAQDIVFLFDHSGSMWDDIAAVLANAEAVVNAIFNPANGLLNSRMSVLSYEQDVRKFQAFTTNPDPEVRKAAVIEALGQITTTGGTENIANALLYAMRGNAGAWRPEATVRQIFVFTDEPGNDTGRLSDVYALAPDVTEGAGEIPVPVIVTTIALGNYSNTRSVMRAIAENTGGQALTASDANDLVDVLLSALASATEGPDALFGTIRDNLLDGLGGDDTLDAREGNDTLLGRDGMDILTAGQGNDLIWGGNDNDRIEAGAGNDTASGGDGDDLIDGHRDNDLLRGNDGSDTVRGGIGDDTVHGGRGADLLSGNQGHDTVHGGEGDDYVRGWGGSDRLEGGGGNDLLEGNQGNDTIWGGRGNDTANGGEDDDFLAGHRENDLLYGETGNDTLIGGKGDDTAWGGQGNDSIAGNAGNDLLRGGNGGDTVKGGEGDDTLVGGTGADELRGGSGTDLVSYAEATQRVVADLTDQSNNSAAALGDTFVSIEQLEGSDQDDQLTGNAYNNHLIGRDSTDILRGESGDDLLSGGADADRFVFASGDGDDTITDHELIDTIRLVGITVDTVATQGADTLITFSSGDSVLLENVLLTEPQITFDLV